MKPLDYMNALNSLVLEALPLVEKNSDFAVWNKMNSQGREELVTSLDVQVHEVIRQKMLKDFPDATLLSEEDETSNTLGHDLTFILDPIDGTREFIGGKPYYAISLAASKNREIVAAVVAYPAMGKILRAAKGIGAWDGLKTITIGESLSSNIRMAVSPREIESEQAVRLQAMIPRLEFIPIPALTPKVGAVLMGQVDAALYFGLGGVAHLWDYAAVGLVALEAGALFTDLNGNNLLSDLPLVNTKGWVVSSMDLSALVISSNNHQFGGHNV